MFTGKIKVLKTKRTEASGMKDEVAGRGERYC